MALLRFLMAIVITCRGVPVHGGGHHSHHGHHDGGVHGGGHSSGHSSRSSKLHQSTQHLIPEGTSSECGNACDGLSCPGDGRYVPNVDWTECRCRCVPSDGSVAGHNLTQASGGCPLREGRGYLISLGFNNQFNNQLEILAEAAVLAKRLDRVLVLTGFLELDPSLLHQPSSGGEYWASQKTMTPAAAALDLGASLGGTVPYIDWGDFVNACPSPGETMLHTFMESWDPPFSSARDERSASPWQLPQVAFGDAGWDDPRNRPQPELGGVTFSSARLIAHAHDRLSLSELPSSEAMPVAVVENLFFKSGTGTDPPYDQAEAFEVMSRFRFSAEVIHQAQVYTDGVGYGAYVAVHWRRGYTADMPLRSIDEIVSLVSEARESLGDPDTTVYVASNALSGDEVALLSQRFGGAAVHSLVVDSGEGGGLDQNTLSRVEQQICVNAKAFIPTPGSTWSMVVQAMRGEHVSSFDGRSELIWNGPGVEAAAKARQ